ncbi:MAG: site-specific DNA-methyltransferase, partial [Phycisphaerales bacterium]|nr:site-specific DNA-methyltransferase [Phycisphaerales bacterium]
MMKKLTIGDPETKSADIVAENILRFKLMLQAIFPEAFAEGKIDFDVLKQLLGNDVDERDEKYGLHWHGKRKARQLALTPSLGTLRPCPQESVDWDTTQNLMIEGDNLEVLKLLQKSYAGKVKMIYIDPPYNTGKDFVYPDNFQDNIQNYLELTGQSDLQGRKMLSNPEASGRFHTDWLNMMYPRLKLARNLLRDDGVMFVSIDDNEVSHLKNLCDEVFGENNFLGLFVVNSTPNARDYGHIGKMHEFTLLYGKIENETITNMLPESDKSFKYSDKNGGFNIHPLYNSNEAFTKDNRPNLYYSF